MSDEQRTAPGLTSQDPDLAITAATKDLLVRFRGVGGHNDGLLIFERIDSPDRYPGGADALSDAIIHRLKDLRRKNPHVDTRMQNKTGIGLI